MVWAYYSFFLPLFTPRKVPQVSAVSIQASAPIIAAAPLLVDPLLAQCAADMPAMLAKAREYLRKKEALEAVNTLYPCRNHFPDDKSRAFYVSAGDALSIQTVKQNEKEEIARKKARKQEGVQIGMSREEAVESSWGRPRKVNTTTRASGTREQWVYDGGYLYFEDGVLTSIQN